MKVLGKTQVLLRNEELKKRYWSGEVEVRLWETGDPFPALGKEVGIDTETELITDSVKDPPMVVYGCFDPESSICWIVYWNEALPFMQYVSTTSARQYYFNVGFDELVIDNEDPDNTLLQAVDAGRVRDMQIRYHLWLLATAGDIPKKGHSKLYEIAKRMLNVELDKGQADDPESHRLTFKRHNPDGTVYRMTEKQAIYLAWDCISTWGLAKAVPEQITEVQHTKGMIVLAHIMRNGFQVDMRVWNAMDDQLLAEMEEARERLMSFGFPDPEKRNDSTEPQETLFKTSLQRFCEVAGVADVSDHPSVSKDRMRFLLTFAYNYRNCPDEHEIQEFAKIVPFTLSDHTQDTQIKMLKPVRQMWNEVLEKYDLLAFDSNKRKIVPVAFVGAFLEDLVAQWQDPEFSTRGVNFDSAVEHASQYMDDHPWLMECKADKIGPKKFFLQHVNQMLEKYPKLVLDKSKKTKQPKLAKDDMWRLEDLGIKDDFLTAHTEYYHLRKFRNTYLNRTFIAGDGRIHARFMNLKRTSRTSCNKPNLQNLPSREKAHPIKNVFIPFDGTVLCATDYSFIELVSFAQTCYSRFGFSVMRDVINADIDPHRWFAGIMLGVIDADLKNKDDPEWVARLNKFLKEKVPDEIRQTAKAGNFGLPGGMGKPRFYLHLRNQGIKATMDEAGKIRDMWIKTFPEMRLHMNPEKAVDTGDLNRNLFGYHGSWRPPEDDDDDLEEDEEYEENANGKDDAFGYRAVLPCGQIRNRCSYCAACNAMFQGTTAVGVKLAGYDLVRAGYGERLVNLIHDEYVYCLYPDELKTHIPIIEKIMIQGMRKIITDVKVKVETTCMLHWDKKATEFTKLQWNPDGTPIIEEPPYVKNLLINKE